MRFNCIRQQLAIINAWHYSDDIYLYTQLLQECLQTFSHLFVLDHKKAN